MARTPPDLTLALTQSLHDGRHSISPASQLKLLATGGGRRGTKHVAGRESSGKEVYDAEAYERRSGAASGGWQDVSTRSEWATVMGQYLK